MNQGTKWLLLLLILCAGCTADLGTKNWASRHLKGKPSIEVVPKFLSLCYTENRAMAFSVLHQVPERIRRPLLTCLHTVTFGFLLVLIYFWRSKSFLELLPFAFVLAGALGNIPQKIIFGHAVDFILMHYDTAFYWPVFNVADILLCVGAGLFMLQIMQRPRRPAGNTVPPCGA